MTGKISKENLHFRLGYIPCDSFFILNTYNIACFMPNVSAHTQVAESLERHPQCPAAHSSAGGTNHAKLKLYPNAGDKCPHE